MNIFLIHGIFFKILLTEYNNSTLSLSFDICLIPFLFKLGSDKSIYLIKTSIGSFSKIEELLLISSISLYNSISLNSLFSFNNEISVILPNNNLWLFSLGFNSRKHFVFLFWI